MSVNTEGFESYNIISNVKIKVKVTLEHSTMAQKGSRGIALLFL